ncbi:hypothetical protein P9222_05960 [Paenibacillus amylolyticus]|nr:hypothetical protein [Paenibacillus amylolyticus]WFR63804.1 hypothetical protein P9222_05960 [Paenibacillus amylolyticus]
MRRTTHMDRTIFRVHLLSTLDEIKIRDHLKYEDVSLVIEPVFESDKSLNGADEIMRLVVLTEDNVRNRRFTVDEAVDLLCWRLPLVPLWIDVSLVEVVRNEGVFKLACSLRLRKPTELLHTETGHAPFRADFQ